MINDIATLQAALAQVVLTHGNSPLYIQDAESGQLQPLLVQTGITTDERGKPCVYVALVPMPVPVAR